jgi:hypothetical protein
MVAKGTVIEKTVKCPYCPHMTTPGGVYLHVFKQHADKMDDYRKEHPPKNPKRAKPVKQAIQPPATEKPQPTPAVEATPKPKPVSIPAGDAAPPAQSFPVKREQPKPAAKPAEPAKKVAWYDRDIF